MLIRVFGPPCAMHGRPRDFWALPVGLYDGNSLRATWRRRLPTDQGVKILQILIETNEGPNSNAAVPRIPMTADNGSLTILNSLHSPSVNGSLFKWPGCCITSPFTRLYVGPVRRKHTQ